ncbi:MAG: carboxypeptidase regulatory-like domain-containing protein, partial [Armatimonadetes bacterium]|nr:carboxypeptidase regulatory-like domain-containing protein [Armatimonadota bacterium]
MKTSMERIFWYAHARLTITVLAAVIVLAMALPVGAQTWDLAKDFSVERNPSGVWTYGWMDKLGGSFKQYDLVWGAQEKVPVRAWCLVGPDPFGRVAKNISAEPYENWGKYWESGTVDLMPPRDQGKGAKSAVRWTAQRACTVEIGARFTGQSVSGTTADVHVVHNGVSIFDGVIDGFVGRAKGVEHVGALGKSYEQPFAALITVAQNDTIDFVVGAGEKWDGQPRTFKYSSVGLVANVSPADSARVGSVSGRVISDEEGGPPVPGAIVKVEGGSFLTTTDSNGKYSMRLLADTITLEVLKAGYAAGKASVTMSPGGEVSHDFIIRTALLWGKVSANLAGNPPIGGAVVSSLDGSFKATTDMAGKYAVNVPPGTHVFEASAPGYQPKRVEITTSASKTEQGFSLAPTLTWDFAADFSVERNPNGVWSYGWVDKIGGAFEQYDLVWGAQENVPVRIWCLVGPDPFGTVSKNMSDEAFDGWGHYWEPGATLSMPPRDQGKGAKSAVRWTAPRGCK